MLKAALGVIAGYAAMAVFIFVTFSGVYLGMGADRAFQPGTYEVSALWLTASLTLSLVAAIFGGWVCAKIAGSGLAPKVLAGLVLVLGIGMALPALNPETDTRPVVRSADVGNMEAMTNARQPPWVTLSLPLIGAVGVLLGAGRRR